MFRTNLERRIEEAEVFGALVHRRQRYFSVDYGVWLRREDVISVEAISLRTSLPDGDWVKKNFVAMVRDEGIRTFDATEFKEPPNDFAAIGDDAMADYLEMCEEMVFGLRCDAIIRNSDFAPEVKIQRLLADPELGNSANRANFSVEEIRRLCDLNSAGKAPLTFVLPAFPFKEQNEFRSYLPAHAPDYGEIGLICRLHALAMAINQVYRNDVRWLIITDGTAYERIFGAPEGCARSYIANLRAKRNRLNLQSTIHFVDLVDLIEKYDALAAKPGAVLFGAVAKHISYELERLDDDEAQAALHNLAEGMKWNRCWRNVVSNSKMHELWAALCSKLVEGTADPIGRQVYRLALDTAKEYAAFNLSMRWTNLIDEFFPWAMRATSHPKQGQVGIPRIGSVSPWNGISEATLDQGRPKITSKPLYLVNVAECVRLVEIGGAPVGLGTREFANKYRI